MKKEIYVAAAKGNVEFLQGALAKDLESMTALYSDTDFLGLTSHGNNIIHVAAKHGHLDFIVEAFQSFQADDRRNLICGTNSDGYTPLHFAAIQHTQEMAQCLIGFYGKIIEAPSAPWRIQNKDGNTPLHLALMNGGRSIRVAGYFLEIDPELAALTNNRKEVPLHLAVTYAHQGTEKSSIEVINSLNSQEEKLSTGNVEYILLSLINSLLRKNSQACCLCDADGMTPLLRAAVRSNLLLVDTIINACPESIEVYDPKGKNVLHYIRFPTFLATRKFLEKPEVLVLLIDQDHDGNTPTHIAVMNQDFKMVRAMVEHNANFAIENKEGVSVQTLFDQFAINNKLDVSSKAQIESKPNKFHDLIMEKENERGVIKEEFMSNDLYKAVGNGNLEIIRRMLKDEKRYLSRLPDGSNIIHLAIEGLHQRMFDKKYYEKKQEPYVKEEQFIVEALKMYPILFSQTNHRWQTPLHLEKFHLMWKVQDLNLKIRGEPSLYSKINSEMMNLKGRGELPLPPWTVKDLHGNTILHTAIKHGNYEFAEYLIELDSNLALEVNHSKQTPLHLICQQFPDVNDVKKLKVVSLLIEKEGSSAVYSRDVEGFTPLLIAAQHGDYGITIEIVKQHPQSIRQTDSHARNYFHHLSDDLGILFRFRDDTIPHREMEILITQKDDQGNTPLDLAVEMGHFWKALYLIQLSGVDMRGQHWDNWLARHKGSTYRTILSKGKTPDDLKEFLDPRGSRTLFWKFNEGSKYGVGIEEIKEYMNPMGVVAALLATITFTAAFTVPGDYNDNGFPNLGKKAAFQVFMFMDVVGMCSSMMVLFCLLWLLPKDLEDSDAHMTLVDITIDLLRISFYTTLIAFMAGVYVTTISIDPWLAIFTCVLCSLLMLLMRRSQIKMLSTLFTMIPNDPLIIVKALPRIVRYCFH